VTYSKIAIGLLGAALLAGCGDDEGSDGDDGACPRAKSVPEAVELYGAAWNEPDETRRNCLLARSVTEDLVYVDPTIDSATAADLSAAIAAFQTSAPGASIVTLSGLDRRDGELRFAWDFRIKDPNTQQEQSAVKGVDYMEIAANGLISNIRGYWDPVPTAAPDGALADYVDAWRSADAAARDAKLSTSLSDDARFTSEDTDARGRAAISKAIGELGATRVDISGAQRYPKFARLALELQTASGTLRVADYLYLDGNGRITRAARFAGDLPPL
jgi:hypothetical protein